MGRWSQESGRNGQEIGRNCKYMKDVYKEAGVRQETCRNKEEETG
jgi:hypothetical protein